MRGVSWHLEPTSNSVRTMKAGVFLNCSDHQKKPKKKPLNLSLNSAEEGNELLIKLYHA